MAKLERNYQAGLKKRILNRFPGSVILKTDPSQMQGIPDLLVLYKDRWALLEVKRDKKAKRQPNQETYVDQFNQMSFSAFIYPENEEEILDELQQSFES